MTKRISDILGLIHETRTDLERLEIDVKGLHAGITELGQAHTDIIRYLAKLDTKIMAITNQLTLIRDRLERMEKRGLLYRLKKLIGRQGGR